MARHSEYPQTAPSLRNSPLSACVSSSVCNMRQLQPGRLLTEAFQPWLGSRACHAHPEAIGRLGFVSGLAMILLTLTLIRGANSDCERLVRSRTARTITTRRAVSLPRAAAFQRFQAISGNRAEIR